MSVDLTDISRLYNIACLSSEYHLREKIQINSWVKTRVISKRRVPAIPGSLEMPPEARY
jgi:hypothetical protein